MNRTKLLILALAVVIGAGLFLARRHAAVDAPHLAAAPEEHDDRPVVRDLVPLPSSFEARQGLAMTNFIPEDLEPVERDARPEPTFEQRRLRRRMQSDGFRRMMNGAVMPLRDPGQASEPEKAR